MTIVQQNTASKTSTGISGTFAGVPGAQPITGITSPYSFYGAGLASTADSGATQTTKPTTSSEAAANAAAISNTLRQYGLEELIPMVDQWVRAGLSWSEIEAQLYDTTSAAGKVLDRIYPEIQQLRTSGKEPLSVAQIQQLRSQYRNVFRAHDTPADFYDQPSDFTTYIVGGKSPAELDTDLKEWRQVADEAAADPENTTTLSELHRLYGVTADSGAFLAYVIDPKRGLDALQKQISSGRLSATAARTGFGALGQQQAEQLAARGIDAGQAAGTFADLAHSRQLTEGIVGVQGETLTRDEQLAAGFGADAAAQDKLTRVRGQRVAEFAGGGRTAAPSRAGRTGLRPV